MDTVSCDLLDGVNFQQVYFDWLSDMKLPVTVKQLLTLRRPQANSSPSWEKLHGVFTLTLRKAEQHNARDGWLALAVCIRNRTTLVEIESPPGCCIRRPLS